jgi:AcrR family transcriptional regulator
MTAQETITKKQKTTQQIISSAADVFSEVGFAGARVDAIAARAKVNKATIYYHIGDKKALYAEVLHNVFSNLADRISMEIKDSLSPEEKLRTFIQHFAEMLDRHPYLPPIMLREIASAGQNLPDLVIKDMTQFFAIVRAILAEGINTGVFKPVTPFVVHMMILGSTVFYKASGSVRTQHSAMPETLKQMDTNVSGKIADEIEALILEAVKK